MRNYFISLTLFHTWLYSTGRLNKGHHISVSCLVDIEEDKDLGGAIFEYCTTQEQNKLKAVKFHFQSTNKLELLNYSIINSLVF